MPNGCEVYGVSTSVNKRSIITYDYRGDKLRLSDLKIRNAGYSAINNPLVPKLFAFSKYHKPEIPFENGFLLKMEMDDVELYHEYTGEDGVYNINTAYQVRLSVLHKNDIIVSDTLHYNETISTFTSELSGEDVHIIATNKANELALTLNDQVLPAIISSFHQFSKDLVDLSFTQDFIKFYGISKSKKLITGEETKVIEKRIKKLENLDKDILNRDAFNKELEELTTIFIDLRSSDDYKNHESYRFYVHANLASLYTLREDFGKVHYHYNLALTYTDKARFTMMVNEQLGKAMRRKENQSLLFDSTMGFNESYSANYLEIHNTRKRVIN